MTIEAFSVLQVKLVFCIFGSILCGSLIVLILTKIEKDKSLSATTTLPAQVDHNGNPFPNDLQLEHEKVDDDDDSTVSGLSKIQSNRQEQESKLQLILNCGMVAILLITSYALLVVSGARTWLSIVAEVSVLGLFLRTQIQEEITRRQRVDRLLAILTLFLFAVSFLSISTYCRKALQEGEVYQGPARIIGYDQTNYENQNGRVTQSDLEVAWGGIWGCKDENVQCNAIVSGAMCQADDRRRRRLAEGDADEDAQEEVAEAQEEVSEAQEEVAEAQEEVEEVKEEEAEVEDEAVEYVDEVIDEADEEIEEISDEADDEADELDQKEEELDEAEEEKEELEEQNEELLDEVNELGGAVEAEFEDEAAQQEGEYYAVDDDYYDYDYWDGVWGEYSCSDLFDEDIEGMEFDADEPPGEDDEWPFVNIYGNCDTCEAFLDDYYTSEHFNSIKNYKTQGQYYLLAAVGCLVATIILACQHQHHPSEPDNEIELLPNGIGGGVAA